MSQEQASPEANCPYDEDYYMKGYGGPVPYERNDYWLRYFQGIADHIVRALNPRKVLDAGCAKGFLVEALWEHGVEAYGIDVSEYAISQVRRDMQPYCRRASLTEPIEGKFDLVTCLEVLEHMPADETRLAIQNLTAVADVLLFSSTPTVLDEPTHVNVRPIIGWLKAFAEFEFGPDLLFDASFIAPHAMLLRRQRQKMPEETMVLYAELIRYRLVLTDRHAQLEHLKALVARLEAEKANQNEEIARSRQQAAEQEARLAHCRQEHAQLRQQDLTTCEAKLEQLRQEQLAHCETSREQLTQEQMRKWEAERDQLLRQWQQEIDLRTAERASTEQVTKRLAGELERLATEIGALRKVCAGQEEELRALRTAELQELRTLLSDLSESHNTRSERLALRLGALDSRFTDTFRHHQEVVEHQNSRAERLALRLGSLETRAAQNSRRTDEILHSRIWRTLRFGGGVLLKPGGLFSFLSRGRGVTPGDSGSSAVQETHQMVCDDPPPDDASLRAGKVSVRGWAVAESGIERVEIAVDDEPLKVQRNQARPDVARSFANLPEARTSGFSADIDTSTLSSGPHWIRIHTVSRMGTEREIRRSFQVDHDLAYASEYERWIAEFEERDEAAIRLSLRSMRLQPRISVITPVFKTPPEILRRTIESVIAQSYPNWELCLADDCSGSESIEELLREYARTNPRIRVAFRNENGGIAAASNSALELASGDYAALLDHDDELAPDALYHVVEAINRRPETDIFYSDEDKIDVSGRRYEPFFKPEWSPDLLLSENYVAHFLVCRRELMTAAGNFRSGFDGSQDYDLILRLTSATDRIVRIPKVLYHWRALPSSTASVSTQKHYAADAARRAIKEHVDRCGVPAEVVPGRIPGRWRVRYRPPSDPLVDIIIASGGKVDVLATCLTSLQHETRYPNYEIVVIDNSKRGEIQDLVKHWRGTPVRYIDWRNQPFNYSTINNEAARQCDAPLLLFLNDDTSVIAGDWLNAMVEMASRPEVGAVGAKLLYPDGRIQHAGVVLGVFDNCGHAFKGLDGNQQHYFDFPDVIRNVSAVTGACLMTRSEVFRSVGGFDEKTFPVAFNDIDLCLRIGQKGYRVIYTPHALLYHHEAWSKTAKDLIPSTGEVSAMQVKWRDIIEADPFYSPNLTRTSEDYSLRRRV